jgi:hypothetical protein
MRLPDHQATAGAAPAPLLAALLLSTAAVQLWAAPALPAQAAGPEAFVPAGWQIEQRQTLDLDRDGRPDAVLLLRADTPPSAPGSGQSPERVLAVLKARPSGWQLVATNDRLVPQVDLATQEDPLANGELLAEPGSFSLSLGLTSSAGSYLSAVVRYRFRVEGSCVRLIGYDRMQTHRGTLQTQDTSVNLLTGAVLHTSGNAQGDTTAKRRARLAANPRRCLDALDSAASFTPLGEPR